VSPKHTKSERAKKTLKKFVKERVGGLPGDAVKKATKRNKRLEKARKK
jgi:hypothetical protein